MSQIKEFLEKAVNNKVLMTKLDELSLSGASDDEIIALAAKNGFIITKEDIEEFTNQEAEYSKINEEELEKVAGGASQNRYDPKVCPSLKRTRYECVGFLSSCWCDHYRKTYIDDYGSSARSGEAPKPVYRHRCSWKGFNYLGLCDGTPYYGPR